MAVTEETVKTETTTPIYDSQQRIGEINKMYDSYANSQKAALEGAYNQNLSDLEANRAKIAQQYQTQRNINAVNYERTRRNFNQQASMNGLNTGAASQASLALNNQYLGGAAQIGAAEANANTSLEKSIADLKRQYETDVNQAIAKNDYNRAAALLDEYNNAYSKAMTKAQTLAQYGDFSGYSDIYGADAARQMNDVWTIQNPLMAYSMGRIDANRYKAITGAYPPSYVQPSRGGGGSFYGGVYDSGENPEDGSIEEMLGIEEAEGNPAGNNSVLSGAGTQRATPTNTTESAIQLRQAEAAAQQRDAELRAQREAIQREWEKRVARNQAPANSLSLYNHYADTYI